MISEGKNNYHDIIRDRKIKKAMQWASERIDALYGDENLQFDAFIYNLNTDPKKNPSFYVDRDVETIEEAMKMGHFNDIAYHKSYVVIIVYLNEKAQTGFRLVYSSDFDDVIKNQLDREFNQ